MTRTVYRPFTKVITVAAATEVKVELKDSTAALVSCNFVSVESASGTSNDGFILVQSVSGDAAGAGPAGASATNAAQPTSPTTSGMLGVACPNLNGVCQLVLGIGDRTNCVSLINTGSAAVDCIVSYGNVNIQNPVKDIAYGRGS